jgi:N-acetylglutamate synthase-like GNAT family acetyltransferase
MVSITLWKNEYRSDFIALNRAWIERYFRLEESDEKIFSNPEKIIDDGGQIFFALEDGKAVGCCALVHHASDNRYELAKMAVSPEAQGKGTGLLLGKTLLEYAKEKGVKKIFLEANTALKASVSLYYKLGFKAVEDYKAAYDRCDLYMEKEL